MADLVGGALLSSFFKVLFDRLASQEILNLFRGKKILAKLLGELKTTLLFANKLLNDAEEKQLTDENVRKWLEELKEVVYEADHMMDKISTEALRRKVEGGDQFGSRASKLLNSFSTLYGAFESSARSEIEEILSRLKVLLAQKDVLGLKEGGKKILSQRLPAPWVEESDVYGREGDKENLVELLLSCDVSGVHKNMSAVAIVGMAGIGKTTLAQLVYNDNRVRENFNLREWITLSEEVDIFEVTKAIFEKTSKKKSHAKELYQLQDDLKKLLMGKKFLYVLDDVWNEDYHFWELLQSPFGSGGQGSKIVVTTRSTIVVSKMCNVRAYDLQTISDDDCWQLFTKHAFANIDREEQSDLHDIGIEIVKKCKGLPLAVKSIAGVLRSVHPDDWRLILQSNIWELQFHENGNPKILPALWLSYHLLPTHLKRCFTYFSIFPKDYAFCKSELERITWLWMAEGLLQPQEGKRVEDIGEEYLKALISRSFFQQSGWDRSTLVMHDLMHDLAKHMSGEFCFLLDSGRHSSKLTRITRHLSCTKDIKDAKLLEDLSKTKCLRTLLSLPLSYDYLSEPKLTQDIPHEVLLKDGECIRALSLSRSSITKLPYSIGNIKYLRYLDLSSTNVEEIPISMGTLYNLQTLLLSNCKKITQLPTNMCNLINLRHLVIRDTPLKEMPPQMCSLRNLQTLSDFVLGEDGGSRIKELGELQFLHGSLFISGLENVVDIGDVLEANLKNKEHLTELILKWEFDKTEDSTKEREVLKALEPHRKLKKLKIIGYGGTTFPDWVAQQSFGNMVEVSLQNCPNCCLLPPLGQLPSLKELRIENLDGLESIGDEFCGTSLTTPFPSLVILWIHSMNSLKKWSLTEAKQEGQLFPCLKHIDFKFCHNLNIGLPACPLPCLETIDIWDCEKVSSVLPTSQVEIDRGYPSLESITIYNCPRVESFSRMGFPSSLKELQVWACPVLISNRLNWDLQRLSSLQSLWLSGCFALDSYPDEWLLPNTLTSIRIESDTETSNCETVVESDFKAFPHLIYFPASRTAKPQTNRSRETRVLSRRRPAPLSFSFEQEKMSRIEELHLCSSPFSAFSNFL